MHKIMAGLYDMKTQAGNDQALDVVVKMAGWVDAWTAAKTEEHMQDILNTEYGGMNDVLYNLAAATGDDRWARTGDRFTKKIFFTPLVLRHDALKGQHMNTHVPQVIGAARRYELSSDYRFRDVSRFFFETVSEAAHLCHRRIQQQRALARRSRSSGSRNEGQRTSPGMLLLLQHDEARAAPLYVGSATAAFMDYYERNLLNHRLGTIEPETGHTTYFLSLAPGAWKTTCTEDDSFWCCTGTGVEEYSKLNNTIYFHDDDSLYVNLYFASTVDWKDRGIRLKQSTNFPESDRTELNIEKTPGAEWTLRVSHSCLDDGGKFRRRQRQAAGSFRHAGQLSGHHSRLEGRRPRRTHPSRCA